MVLYEYVLLVILAAIWGASFIFMRILVPIFGPIATADLRLLIAGIILTLFLKLQHHNLGWKKNWKRYLVIGLLNSGFSFILFSFAALYLPASISVILNSLTPMFGALSTVIWLGEKMRLKLFIGILLGVLGVAVIRGGANVEMNIMTSLSMGACVLATMFYGFGGVYVKKTAHDLNSSAIAAGSQLTVGLLFFPLIFVMPNYSEITLAISFLMFSFAFLCSAVAYLIYYRLVKNLGPVKTATVTFLIPVFGFIWGAIFLHETITISMIAGSIIVLSGTYFVMKKKK